MPDSSVHNTIANNIQHLVIGGCTYEIHSIFGSKIKLEEIIAQRVLKELNTKKEEEKACFSADDERSCLGK